MGAEGENMRDSLEEGHDCRVGKLVMNITPPTFKRIMLLVDIVLKNSERGLHIEILRSFQSSVKTTFDH